MSNLVKIENKKTTLPLYSKLITKEIQLKSTNNGG